MTHQIMSHQKKKKIYENLDFRHFWWFLRLLLHSAQSFISSSWYESLLWVIADRIRLRIRLRAITACQSTHTSCLSSNHHQSEPLLLPLDHLRVGAREQHMMTHQQWVISMTSCSSQSEEEACQVPQYIDL